jgi:hypothetical protein
VATAACTPSGDSGAASAAGGQAAVETPAAWVNDLAPIDAGDWNYQRAAHLLERAGFGGTPAEIEALVAMGPAGAVDHLNRAT